MKIQGFQPFISRFSLIIQLFIAKNKESESQNYDIFVVGMENSNISNFQSNDFLDKLKFSSTIKGYVTTNESTAKIVTMLNNVKIGIINLTVRVSASNGYERKPFIGIPNEMKPSKNIIINGNVNGEHALAYYQSYSGSFVIVYNKSVQEDAEVSLFGAYLISG